MRIERLHIDGFGHYHDREIGPFGESLTLVTGQNEAGKSTLLAFVRAVLFGFPTRLGAQHYPPLSGGRHGGRITLRLDDGRTFIAEREQGRGAGPFQARGEDGAVLQEPAFASLIGHASETLFRSAFTFDLDDLPSFDAADGDLGGLLYGVSMGAERLPQAMSRLDSRVDEIFMPRGSNQVVAGLLRGLEETAGALREMDGQANEYRRLTERRTRIGDEIAEADRRLQVLAQRQQELDRQQRAWKDWTDLRFLRERLDELEPTEGFPANGVERFERIEGELREAEATLEEAERDLEEAREEAQQEVPNAALLEQAEVIEGLRRDYGDIKGAIRDLPGLEADLASGEEDLKRRLAELGPGWDEARLDTFDVSMPRRDRIAQWQRTLDDTRTAAQDQARELDGAKRLHREAVQAQADAERELEPFAAAPDREAVRERTEALGRLRMQATRHESARQRVADLEAQRAAAGLSSGATAAPPRSVLIAVGILGAILLLAGAGAWRLDEPAVALALATAGIAAAAMSGVLLLTTGRPGVDRAGGGGESSLDALLAEARTALEQEEAALREAARALDGTEDAPDGGVPDTAALDAVQAALDADARRADERYRLEERLVAARREVERAQARVEEAAAAAASASEQAEQTQRDWSAWLRDQDLPPELQPQTARELIGTVEAARERVQELSRLRSRVAHVHRDIDQYRTRLAPVAAAIDRTVDGDDHRAAIETADAIIARFEAARDERAALEQARVTAEERERAVARARRRVTDAQTVLADLLRAGDATTAEEFRSRAEVHEERRAREQQRDERQRALHQICGGDAEALAALDRALGETSAEAIEAELEAVRSEHREAQRLRDELHGEDGEVRRELEHLHGDVAASEARARAAVLREELHAAAGEWSSLVVARALLRRTRERYERERQPAVIQRASDFFGTLTGGRYARLYQPIGESTVTVEDRDGSAKTPDQLSRGTREQLYLALRLGAIEEAAESHERLPVIVDEVLVNFDPDRARLAVDAFAQLAQRTQVIVFTCHPWVADLFRQAHTKPAVLELD